MNNRIAFLVVFCPLALSGCSTPELPRFDLSGATLPRFEMFRYGTEDTSIPTTPYVLSPTETADIKSQFSAEFRDGRTLQFGPISARRQTTGSLVVCGLVDVQTPDGTRSGMVLFDGIASPLQTPGRLGFTPQRIAGGNAKALDVYSDCRDAGLI